MQAVLFSLEVKKIATTRIMALHIGKGRTVSTAISDIIDYVKNPEKTDHGNLISSWQCDSRTADSEFVFFKQQYIRKTGRTRNSDDVIAYHLRQSFRPGEITAKEANRLGYELAKRFTKGNHAFIVCTHTDKAHIHNHIIWSATSLDATRKFRDFHRSAQAVRRLSDTICIQNGYSIIANPTGKGKSYNKWLGGKKEPSHRERICYAIDEALAQKPKTFEELLVLLQQAGYQVKDGKVPSLLGGDQQRFLRMDTLGEAYSPDTLRAIIKGSKTHTPKRKNEYKENSRPSGSLLIDIQAKLDAGKGPGYAKWATSYNLKQMSKTMIYLQENNLLDLALLNQRTEEASAKYHDLSKRQKDIERRLSEIAVLQEHAKNYNDTRADYVAYRKAGYSKKFLAEHEKNIILHKAAKEYFDKIGIVKIPSPQSLHAEFNQLLTEKKAIFSEYKEAQAKMRELQTANANVDRFLKLDFSEPAKEKDQKQR